MKTAVLIALVGLALAASYEFPFSEDEGLASENKLEETNDNFPSERKEIQAFEEDLDGTDYKESEGREDENNAIQNDVDDDMEEEMDSAFNDLYEQMSDPRRRGRRSSRRSSRSFRSSRRPRSRSYRRRSRRRSGRRRYCIRMPGKCGK